MNLESIIDEVEKTIIEEIEVEKLEIKENSN